MNCVCSVADKAQKGIMNINNNLRLQNVCLGISNTYLTLQFSLFGALVGRSRNRHP